MPEERSRSDEASEQTENYLLIKNLPPNVSEEAVLRLFGLPKRSAQLLRVDNSPNVYVRFAQPETAAQLCAVSAQRPFACAGRRLKLFWVQKLPLDLNHASRVVLITLYHEQLPINIATLSHLLRDYGPFARMIIYKKKNFQALIEFFYAADAAFFRSAVDGRVIGDCCTMKVQFTRKTGLVVRFNSAFEHDWVGPDASLAECPAREAPKAFSTPSTALLDESFDSALDGSVCNLEDVFRSEPDSPAAARAVLTASNLAAEVAPRHLFNLFSLYGSIRCIAEGAVPGQLRVQFDSATEASTALYYLDGLELFGRPLALEMAEETEQALSPRYMRGKSRVDYAHKQRTMNKPSAVLYLFNLEGRVELEELREFIAAQEEVRDLRFVNNTRSSALCFMNSMESAARALCVFKNARLGAVTLKINFANEQLVRGKATRLSGLLPLVLPGEAR